MTPAGSPDIARVAGRPPVTSTAAIRLVAGREVVVRLRSKAFRVLTLIMLLLIVAMVIVAKALTGDTAKAVDVGVLGMDAAQAKQMESVSAAAGQEISAVVVTDETTARSEVADGSLAALVIPQANGSLQVVVESKLGAGLRNALTVVARDLALDAQIRALGGDPATVGAAVSGAALSVQAISPPRQYDVTALVLGSATGVLIYIALLVGGQLVAQGVVEEKSSRVVEILLATIRPWELMAGKVAGIGLIGLIQVALFGIVGVGLASALGVLTISVTAAIGTVVWLVVWFLIGFVMYAFVFAGAGALVSRQEDIGGVVMPVTAFVILGYILGITILPSDPSNSLAQVLSIVPLFAPTLMPMRLAMGGVPAWEAALALVLALATIPAFAALAGRMYRNAIIHIGARVSLRKALARNA